MNKRIKTKWLKALRSGDYKQGKGRLCGINDKGRYHCCLGVLKEVVTGRTCPASPQDFLSNAILKKVGFTHDDEYPLSDRNDTGWSFKRIATYIEKNL